MYNGMSARSIRVQLQKNYDVIFEWRWEHDDELTRITDYKSLQTKY